MTEADDAGLKIFSEAPPAPVFAGTPELAQNDQTPLTAAPLPEEKPELRRPTEPPSLSPHDTQPSAAAAFEKIDVPAFESISYTPPPALPTQASEISFDEGLSFDDDEALVLDEAGEQEPELSFDDDEALVLDEAGEQEPELSFDDDEELVLDEADEQEPELSFDDDEELVLDEADEQEPELSFNDEEELVLDETGEQKSLFSFDDNSEALAIEEPALDIQEPSLEFEEPSAPGGFAPLPDQTREVDSFSIVTCGQPRKISETSISLPITIRLNKNNAECPITITISLDDMLAK